MPSAIALEMRRAQKERAEKFRKENAEKKAEKIARQTEVAYRQYTPPQVEELERVKRFAW